MEWKRNIFWNGSAGGITKMKKLSFRKNQFLKNGDDHFFKKWKFEGQLKKDFWKKSQLISERNVREAWGIPQQVFWFLRSRKNQKSIDCRDDAQLAVKRTDSARPSLLGRVYISVPSLLGGVYISMHCLLVYNTDVQLAMLGILGAWSPGRIEG